MNGGFLKKTCYLVLIVPGSVRLELRIGSRPGGLIDLGWVRPGIVTPPHHAVFAPGKFGERTLVHATQWQKCGMKAEAVCFQQEASRPSFFLNRYSMKII